MSALADPDTMGCLHGGDPPCTFSPYGMALYNPLNLWVPLYTVPRGRGYRMTLVNDNVLAEYLRNKQVTWATHMRGLQNDPWHLDNDLAKLYVTNRGATKLAEEFQQDRAFATQKICEFMKNRSDREATHMAVAVGVYVLDASAVGVAAILEIAATTIALTAVCLSLKQSRESWRQIQELQHAIVRPGLSIQWKRTHWKKGQGTTTLEVRNGGPGVALGVDPLFLSIHPAISQHTWFRSTLLVGESTEFQLVPSAELVGTTLKPTYLTVGVRFHDVLGRSYNYNATLLVIDVSEEWQATSEQQEIVPPNT